MTDVVADTGDLSAIKQYNPVDATTNPSLLLKAVDLPEYSPLILSSREWATRRGGGNQEILSNSCDKLAVEIGTEILKIIPGRVSSEVDARLSFDEKATIEKAKQLIATRPAANPSSPSVRFTAFAHPTITKAPKK